MFARLSVVLLCGLALAADKAADAKSDLDKLQGKWTVVSIQRGGQNQPDDAVKAMTITFEKDKVKVAHGDQNREMTFKLDPSKTPKWMTVDMMGKPGEGIYSLEGDTLKICHGEEGDARPTEFVSKEGSKLNLMILKHHK